MTELRDTRLEKAAALKSLGKHPYALQYKPSDRMAALQDQHADLPKGEERDVAVSVAGRVMTRRVMGKLAFFTLADETYGFVVAPNSELRTLMGVSILKLQQNGEAEAIADKFLD